jgi:transposase
LSRLRHLPILGRPVIIEIRPKRFRCPTCDGNPTTTQKLDRYDERSLHTKAYDQWLMTQLIGSTIFDMARKEQTTEGAVSLMSQAVLVDRAIRVNTRSVQLRG